MSKAGRRLKKVAKSVKAGVFTEPPSCILCVAGEHLLCTNPDLDKQVCCCAKIKEEISDVEPTEKVRTGPVKEAVDITDVQSTGRKRAARLFPFEEGMICEWSGLKEAGGGVVPIIGCLGNKATARHHGPDKNTLNNTVGNVHRICSFCHNFWHARNDEYYGSRPAGTEPFIPLDGQQWQLHNAVDKATTEELVKAQLGRKQPKEHNHERPASDDAAD